MKPTLFLAPLRGITDHHFRTIFHRNFKGFDTAIAPFIPPQKYSDFPDTMLKDVLPAHNPSLAIIPQILHNETKPFLTLARRLMDFGYSHINWNLGCPAPQVAKKGRGSGMLQYPEKIIALLDAVLPELTQKSCQLSIKMRTGYSHKEEGFTLLAYLNDYPIKEITIHPRLGIQVYRGLASPEIFTECASISHHTLIYNGDIVNYNGFTKLQKQLPEISSFMIGRGAIANPFLAEQIRNCLPDTEDKKLLRLRAFHDELFYRYSRVLSGDSHILGRMKIIWNYLIVSFPQARKKELKDILKSRSSEQYHKAVDTLMYQRMN